MRTFKSVTPPSFQQERLMAVTVATFLGVDYETVLLLTVAIAALWTFLAMVAITFFAWAPFVSDKWRTQFGESAETGHAK